MEITCNEKFTTALVCGRGCVQCGFRQTAGEINVCMRRRSSAGMKYLSCAPQTCISADEKYSTFVWVRAAACACLFADMHFLALAFSLCIGLSNNLHWRDQKRQHYHIHEAIVLKRLLPQNNCSVLNYTLCTLSGCRLCETNCTRVFLFVLCCVLC